MYGPFFQMKAGVLYLLILIGHTNCDDVRRVVVFALLRSTYAILH